MPQQIARVNLYYDSLSRVLADSQDVRRQYAQCHG